MVWNVVLVAEERAELMLVVSPLLSPTPAMPECMATEGYRRDRWIKTQKT